MSLKKSSQKRGLTLDYGHFLKALLSYNKICLLCHHNADPDSFFSAFALGSLLRTHGKEYYILTSEGISALTKRLAEKIITEEVKIHKDEIILKSVSCACLVDSSSLEQLSSKARRFLLREFKGKIAIIDHHEPHPLTLKIASHVLIDPHAKATAILVYRLFKLSNIPLNKAIAESLLAAILYDTRRFVNADSEVFRIVAELLSLNVDYKRVFSLFIKPLDFSERVARLKGARRVRLYEFKLSGKRLLVALSHVSSFEASVARSLVDLGADLAIVAGGNKGTLRICSRANMQFYELTGINLATDIMMPLGELLGGAGGGHALAASANGVGTIEKGLNEALRILRLKLKTNLKELKD